MIFMHNSWLLMHYRCIFDDTSINVLIFRLSGIILAHSKKITSEYPGTILQAQADIPEITPWMSCRCNYP